MVSASCQAVINYEARVLYPKPYISSEIKSSKSTGVAKKVIQFATVRNLPKAKPRYLEIKKSFIEIGRTYKELPSVGCSAKNSKTKSINIFKLNKKIHSNSSVKLISTIKLEPLVLSPKAHGKSISDLDWILEYPYFDVKKFFYQRIYK